MDKNSLKIWLKGCAALFLLGFALAAAAQKDLMLVIDNSGSREETEQQVRALMERLSEAGP